MKLSPLLFLFLLSLCRSSGRIEREVPYEIPPYAPVPPQKTCYESNIGNKGNDITTMELNIVGDSVFGRLDHIWDQKKVEHSSMIGTVIGATLIVNCQLDSAGISKTEEQEWKITPESVFKRTKETVTDDSSGLITQNNTGEPGYSTPLKKVPCR